MKKQKKESARNSKITLLLEVICLVVFLYAASQLWQIFADYRNASKEYDALAEYAVTEQIITETVEESKTSKAEEYDNLSYFVDLDSLKEMNPDTVGWIILPDSKINYPIVKSKDNAEYLTTTFEGQMANSGAIFLDMNCESDFSNQNSIIYGHNMKNGSMFRALNHLTKKDYFETHRIFYMDLGNGFQEYEIISCYETVETDLSSWQIGFESEEAYAQWLNQIAKRCTYDCADYDVSKQTITLSTCRGESGGPGRFIVHLQKK